MQVSQRVSCPLLGGRGCNARVMILDARPSRPTREETNLPAGIRSVENQYEGEREAFVSVSLSLSPCVLQSIAFLSPGWPVGVKQMMPANLFSPPRVRSAVLRPPRTLTEKEEARSAGQKKLWAGDENR